MLAPLVVTNVNPGGTSFPIHPLRILKLFSAKNFKRYQPLHLVYYQIQLLEGITHISFMILGVDATGSNIKITYYYM